MDTVLILHVDKRSISDLLFIQRLGRYLASVIGPQRRIIVVHDGFDVAENAIESRGYDMHSLTRGQWEEVSAAVFAAIQSLNRSVVGKLTEEGIPAVGMQGSDRGLIQMTDVGLSCQRPDMLVDMVKIGSVPVVGPIVKSVGQGLTLQDARSVSVAIAQGITVHPECQASVIEFGVKTNRALLENDLNQVKIDDYAKFRGEVEIIHIQPQKLADTEFWERFT